MHYFVGGSTKLYGAALYRLREEDFGELRHHDGISPAWPIGYDEMEPYYTLAEELYQVHGAAGRTRRSRPRARPIRSRRSRTSRGSSSSRTISPPRDTTRSMRPAGSCSMKATCPSAHGALSRLRRIPVPRAREVRRGGAGRAASLEHENVTLMTNATVQALRHESGRNAITEVVVDNGNGRAGRSRATSSWSRAARRTRAKLLLMSANDKHPKGLANGSDQVGRNYTFHNSQAVLALSREENPTVFQKTLGLNDFYLGSGEQEYPLGNIQMVGKSQAPMFRGEKPKQTKLAPQWTLERMARHAIDFWLSTESAATRQPHDH